jgi:hypothetical protein
VEQQEAAYHCRFHDGRGVPGVWVGGAGGPVAHQGNRGDGPTLLGLCLKGKSVVIECDNTAAISLCKDHKEGQRVKHIDIIHNFAGDHVASGELSFVYCMQCASLRIKSAIV